LLDSIKTPGRGPEIAEIAKTLNIDERVLYTFPAFRAAYRSIASAPADGEDRQAKKADKADTKPAAGNASANGRPRRRCYERDHEWLRCHKQERMGMAAIRDRWNAMTDEARRKVAPLAWEKIGNGRSGRDTVKSALKVAEGEKTQAR